MVLGGGRSTLCPARRQQPGRSRRVLNPVAGLLSGGALRENAVRIDALMSMRPGSAAADGASRRDIGGAEKLEPLLGSEARLNSQGQKYDANDGDRHERAHGHCAVA